MTQLPVNTIMALIVGELTEYTDAGLVWFIDDGVLCSVPDEDTYYDECFDIELEMTYQ